MNAFPHHAETTGRIDAAAATVFDFLDDQANLSAHMSKPSAMMMGTTMDIQMESDHTRRVGSRFGFTGRVLGVPLLVNEVVTSRDVAKTKTWETTSEPTLWVIGSYSKGFDLAPHGSQCDLRVQIDYALPKSFFARMLALLFHRAYARWCTHQMVSDAQTHFAMLVAAGA
ncbi:MAG: SRPBCC family protein [Devosia sp.]